MTVQRSHNRSTSVSSLASVASFKTAHSASPAAEHIDLPYDRPVDPADNPSLDHTAEDEMLLTPVSSGGSGPPSPPQPQAQAALVAAMQTPLPPTPPPRRRTLLLGKGHPRREPSTQESKPSSSLPSHTETPETESAGRSQAISENGQPASPRSLASRLSLASLGEQQQSPTSYESHASRLSHPPSQPHSAPVPAQRELPPTTTEEKQGAQDQEQAQAQEQARWSRPPRSQARKVSKTMQLAREEPTTAPLRPGSSASVASAASSTNGRAGSPTSPVHSGRQPRYSDSAQSHAVPQTPPTHTRSSSSARSDYPSFEEQDDAWAAHVKAQLLRLFPDLGATLPDRSVPNSGLRDELSALRSEIGALRGVVGQLRDERVGGTPPLATKQSQRANSVPVSGAERDVGPAKSRSLAIDTSFTTATGGSDADESVYSEEEPPRRRAPMPPRERLSMYHPSPQEPEMNSAGLTIFATDSDARITLPPSAISLMLDVVRTVDMRTNGVRSDADIFSEENLANLAISQVMN
ncbi:hypothetical protein A1Q2_06463 [Trichosporon asahii var. asahii CBS 8904]|uniref:Uncharacterized protein n=1 Tax=Trichosporon asahii var. asahii (strain CBS 8904) TaxID=1220162 RepID=K1WCB5_TRIAC|nr:hypothetical protein A1Q2_06463 [Trichosporon asahii var. asahii CBS 8904]